MDIKGLKNKIINTTVSTLQNYKGDNPNIRNMIDNLSDNMKNFKDIGTTQTYRNMVKGADAKIHLQHNVSCNIDKLKK